MQDTTRPECESPFLPASQHLVRVPGMAGFFQRLFNRNADGRIVHPGNVPSLPDSDEWFTTENGMPYPRWKRIGNWVADNVEAGDFD